MLIISRVFSFITGSEVEGGRVVFVKSSSCYVP